jgi:zinc protease
MMVIRASVASQALAVIGLLLVACAGAPVTPAPAPPPAPPVAAPVMPLDPPPDFGEGDYTRRWWVAPLESGLRVIVESDPRAPVVAIGTTYRVGASSDPPGREGLAHLVEHLTFLSRPGDEREYREHLRNLATSFNGATSADFTTFWTLGNKDDLPAMMQLEAWRLARTLVGVSEAQFRKEKQVVLNEIRQTAVQVRPLERVVQAMFSTGHPLARPVAGTAESLARIELSDAVELVRRRYTPNACTIVIAGDVDVEQVKKMLGMWPAQVLFGPRGPGGPKIEPRAVSEGRPSADAAPGRPRRSPVTLRGPFAAARLFLGWALPPGFGEDDALMRLAAARLQHLLRRPADPGRNGDQGPPVSVTFLPMLRTSVLLLSAALPEGEDPAAARDRLLARMERVWPQELPAMDMSRLRWLAAMAHARQSEDAVSDAPFKAQFMSATATLPLARAFLERLVDVTDERIRTFGSRWFARDRVGTVRALPAEADAGFSAETVRLHGADGTARDRQEETGPFDESGWSDARVRSAIRSPRLKEVPMFQLPSGLRVYLPASPRGLAPLAHLLFRFPGGELGVQPPGAAGWALRLAHSECDQDGRLLPLGVGWRHSMDTSWAQASVSVLPGNLASGLAGLAAQVRCLRISQPAFASLPRQLEGRRAGRAPEKQQLFAQGKLWRELYPGHPFAELAAPNPTRLTSLTREHLEARLRGLHRPEQAVLVAYGDVSPADVRRLSEEHLTAGWEPADAPPPGSVPAAPPGPSGRKLMLVDRPDWKQALVTIGCRLGDLGESGPAALDVLESLLARKVLALRERWAASYGIQAAVATPFGSATHATLTGYIQEAQVASSLRRLLGVLDDLGRQDLAARDFFEARWDSGRRFMLRFATPENRAHALTEAAMRGWPLSRWDDYPAALAATRPADIQRLLGPCVGKEIMTVVGPARRLKPQLDAPDLLLSSSQ